MSGRDRVIHRILEKSLFSAGYDVSEFISIPNSGDRIVRTRALEEAMQEMESVSTQGESHFYLLQVKTRQIPESKASETPQHDQPDQKVYLSDGSMNVPFLEHNAEVLLSHGDYALARKVFQTLLQSGQRTGQALFGIGYSFEKEGKLEAAIKSYEESSSYIPSTEVFLRIAGILVQQKKDRYAAEVIERALSIKELSLETRFELHKTAGNCWLRIDRYAEAERHFGKALEIKPSSDDVRSNLGSAYLKQKQIAEAKRCFQDAVSANSLNDKAHLGLAICFENMGQKREAHDSFARALKVNMSNPAALYGLMRLGYELKNYAVAEQMASDYCESQPLNVEILFGLAGMQFHLGKISEARRNVERIQEMKPAHAGAQELMAKMSRY